MSRLTIIIATFAAFFLVGACGKIDVEIADSVVVMNYSVSVAEPVAKALGDGSNVNRMAYAIYEGETCINSDVVEVIDGRCSFHPSLYYGRTYTVAMFAYWNGAYDVTDLKNIKLGANGRYADAFAHKETIRIDVNGDLYIDGNKSDQSAGNRSVNLLRPVAQLALVTESLDAMQQAGAAKIRISLNASETYNAVACTSGAVKTMEHASLIEDLGTVSVSDKSYTAVSCSYFFPAENQTVTIDVLKEDNTPLSTFNVSDIPLVANKKTNLIIGAL